MSENVRNNGMTQDGEVLIRVENLCQYFKTLKAVDGVSFDIKKGEVFGLVGESGCGKTTTGRSIIKLYDITSGSVYFGGRRIAAGIKSYKDKIAEIKKSNLPSEEKKKLIAVEKRNIKSAKYDHKHSNKSYIKDMLKLAHEEHEEKKKTLSGAALEAEKRAYHERCKVIRGTNYTTKIQMIFQDPIASLDPRMTVREIIAEGLIIRGIRDKETIDREVYRVLEMVGLVRDHAGRYPHEFSGGQRQRIGIARAIIMNPEVIIADEPVSALDVSIQAQVINLLNDLRSELGLTILFIAHDLSVVKYFSDRIGVMYYGKMVELADSDELFRHPTHPYTKSLLSAIPLPDPEYEKKRQRITYNPLASHDYSVEQPTFREIAPNHFVLCNTEEYNRYIDEYKGETV